MILQALAQYYGRLEKDEDARIASFGFEPKTIEFVVVLDGEGCVREFQDLREGEGRKRRGRVFMVPRMPKRPGRAAWKKTADLWDHVGYVFGQTPDPDRTEWAEKQHGTFKDRVDEMVELTGGDEGVVAVQRFLRRGDFTRVFEDPNWEDALATNANVSFRLERDSRLVCQREAVREVVGRAGDPDDDVVETCLVTGKQAPIARLHPPIKGVWGAQTSGANVVSFNLDAFKSHGREQGDNAPVGERAAFEYTTALNHLLRRDSPQRVQVGDASTVFWAEGTSPLETIIGDLFGEPPKDDPERGTRAVEALYRAPWTGDRPGTSGKNRFFVLGLAPNAARIAVRFWHVDTEETLGEHLSRHFRDMEIVRPGYDVPFLSIFRLLTAIAPLGKADNIRPNLAGEVFMAALKGATYPRELLAAAVQRNRAEQDVTYVRAALIKASLLRLHRSDPHRTPEVQVALDLSNQNTAYRLGRLFAVLERIQQSASPGVKATVRDRFYGAASSTPVTVFPRLLKLKNHHLGKIEYEGQVVNFEKLIGEIMDEIDDFPTSLDLPDQGQFSIGYYHQRQSFFKRSEDKEEDQ